MKYILLSLTLLSTFCAKAQKSATERLASCKQILQTESPFDSLLFRNIGPTVMSGRVTDVEVNPANANEFYVAYASGGVWHSTNNGQTLTPIFDREASHTIGDMAMDWEHGILWVGTGEVNSSRSSYAGAGLYKTSDTGKTWIHCGLEESHHIGRVIIDPAHPQTLWVAVLGHLYTPNRERGIFKTTDGGKTWKQTLYLNDTTGIVDLLIDPTQPDVLYASSWTRTRTAWQFTGNGEGSGIYKSTDGGEHWQRLSTEVSGFPVGPGVGRIGLSLCAQQPNILYALLDNQSHQEKKKEDKEKKKKLAPRDLAEMSEDEFFAMENKELADYLKEQGYPDKYSAEGLKDSVKNKRFSVKDIADWKLADADAGLFDTPVKGAELYVSRDAGISWAKTHEDLLEGVYFTYGYYFGTVAVSPVNPDKVFIAGYPVLMSTDGGKNFKQIDGENCHPDYHRIWINPRNDRHLITGNDGGLNISYDDGKSWFKANNPAVGQFYAIEVDNDKPYHVYGGLQDNGTWTGPSNHTESTAWQQSGDYAYKGIGDGDGMQVQVDTRRNETVYLGYQFGNYFRYNKNSKEYSDIKPLHDIGQKPFRFNWQTPICLSKHNQDIFYMGSNCFHRSMQQGAQLQTLSSDLSNTHQKGNVPFGTLTTLSESPLRFGLLYAGTDDGQIHLSKDAGYSWTLISKGLPVGKWVSRVIASRHKEGRVYVTLNGYRQDDFTPYLFVSEDYGQSWKNLSANLPAEPLNVVREDPKKAALLYAGSDNGLYVSHDAGQHFLPWRGGLPRVAIHDIAIQERENDILLGTHGRSIYVASMDLIQRYTEVKDKDLFIFSLNETRWNPRWGSKWAAYAEPQTARLSIPYYSQHATEYTLRIKTEKGKVLHAFSDQAVQGMNFSDYDYSLPAESIQLLQQKPLIADNGVYYLTPGRYILELSNHQGSVASAEFIVKAKEDKN